jgi:hypothetical protein
LWHIQSRHCRGGLRFPEVLKRSNLPGLKLVIQFARSTNLSEYKSGYKDETGGHRAITAVLRTGFNMQEPGKRGLESEQVSTCHPKAWIAKTTQSGSTIAGRDAEAKCKRKTLAAFHWFLHRKYTHKSDLKEAKLRGRSFRHLPYEAPDCEAEGSNLDLSLSLKQCR